MSFLVTKEQLYMGKVKWNFAPELEVHSLCSCALWERGVSSLKNIQINNIL